MFREALHDGVCDLGAVGEEEGIVDFEDPGVARFDADLLERDGRCLPRL